MKNMLNISFSPYSEVLFGSCKISLSYTEKIKKRNDIHLKQTSDPHVNLIEFFFSKAFIKTKKSSGSV